MAPRETIYAAFAALLTGITDIGGTKTFKAGGRELPAPDQISGEAMPACYVLQIDETPTHVRGVPAIWTFMAEVYLYASTGTQRQLAKSQVLNPLVDAVINVLVPIQQGQIFEQTLGGLVSKCRVSGKVRYGEGLLGDYAIAILPAEITVPQ